MLTPRQQCERFSNELQALCNRYADEYDVTVYEIVGILEAQKSDIIVKAILDEVGDDDEDDDISTGN